MKVRVIINAVADCVTGKIYQAGETMELPEDRANIAIEHGYVEEVKDGNNNAKKSRKAVASDNN